MSPKENHLASFDFYVFDLCGLSPEMFFYYKAVDFEIGIYQNIFPPLFKQGKVFALGMISSRSRQVAGGGEWLDMTPNER